MEAPVRGTSLEDFFQTDASIEKTKKKHIQMKNSLGYPICVHAKILDMILFSTAEHTEMQQETSPDLQKLSRYHAYLACSDARIRHVNLEVSSFYLLSRCIMSRPHIPFFLESSMCRDLCKNPLGPCKLSGAISKLSDKWILG
jgi:hypothetical protein